MAPTSDKTWPGSGANSAYGVSTTFTAPVPSASTGSVTAWVEFAAQTSTGQQLVTAMVRVLKSRTRRQADDPDAVSGPVIHAVYVQPSDGTDNRRDITGEMDAWLQQVQTLMNTAIGKKLRLDLDTNLQNDVTYMKSKYSTAQLFSANADADKLLKQEFADPAIATGSQKKVLAFFVESSGAQSYCGYSRDSWSDPAPAVVIAPIASAGCAKLAPAGVEYISTVLAHEILHTVGVKHVPDAKDLMCGSDSGVTCTGPAYIDPQKAYYVGTTSAYSKVDILTQDIWDRGVSTAPSAPSKVSVKRAVRSIEVTWTAPASDGGSPISGYIVTASPGGAQCTTTGALACTVTGLFNTNVYTFVVEARNINGLSPKSSPSGEIRPATAPSAPASVVTKSGDGSIHISWSPPADDGGLTMTYTATVQPAGVTCTTSQRDCSVSGLDNGGTYLVTVVATNAIGDSPASDQVAATPGTVPKPPLSVKVLRRNGEVVVSWSPPTDTGGFDVTSYTVYSKPGRAVCQTSGLNCTVTGLTNGQVYTFTVVAKNEIGNSPAAGMGGEPLIGVGAGTICAIKADSSGTCWGNPRLTPTAAAYVTIATGQNYGCAITSARKVLCYGPNTAVSSNVPVTLTTAAEVSTGYGHACAVTKDQRLRCWGSNASGELNVPADIGLVTHAVAGRNATCVSTADGAIRCWGQDSNGVVSNAPQTMAPTASLVAGQGFMCALSVTREVACWGANNLGQTAVPAGLGEVASIAAGANHVCAVNTSGGVVCWGDASTQALSPPADLQPVSYIAAGDGFTCALTVVQSLVCWGQSLSGSTVSESDNAALNRLPSMAPGGAPSAPVNVQLVRGKRSLEVRWATPVNNGGFPVTGYVATAAPGGATCTTTELSCVISGLTNGQTYQVTVKATNVIDSSAASSATSLAPGTPPDAPTSVQLTRGSRELRVSWSAPTDDGGFAVQTYSVSAVPGNASCGPTASTTCVLTGLTNGVVYTVSVTATNVLGSGPSATAPDLAPGTVTTPPVNVVAVRGDKQVQLSWGAPLDNGGFPVEGFTVESLPTGDPCSTTEATCVITGLTNGISYSFRVCARNFLGCSTYSDVISAMPAGPPATPNNIVVSPGDRQLAVFWSLGDSGGLPVTVTAMADPGGFTCTSTSMSCSITGLTNGITYTVTVTAANEVGASPAAAPVASMPATLPTPPMNVKVTVGNAQVAVAWDSPTDSGGLPITAYTATATPGGASCTATGQNTCTIVGLTNGTAYTITVTASNSLGASQPSLSAMGTPVSPAKPPAAPGGLKLTNTAAGQVKLAYAAAVANGAAITRYEVRTSTDGKKWVAWAALNQSTKLIKGKWAKGVTLYVQLRAVNSAGLGASSQAKLKLTK
ncbi:MAG: fibronectin type III domain-containing protein [Actinomycetales bacterium]|nr:fibronectin type III domain-containing protein [Actinomycetales bacterium]